MPAVGQFVHALVALLLEPLTDVRDRTADEYLRYFHGRLCPDVKERSVVVPLIAYREGDKLRIIDGWTRALAAKLVGLETVPVIVYPAPPTPDDLEDATMMANEMRLDLSDADRAAEYLRTMQKRGWSQRELCRRRHLDTSKVCRLLKRHGPALPEDIRVDVGKGKPIPPRGGTALARLKDYPDKQREYADKLRNEQISVEDLECKVREILGIETPKAKPRALKIGPMTLTVPADLTDDQVVVEVIDWARKQKKAS